MIRISVIIPTIGRDSLIPAINSVLEQGDLIHEVIVVGSKSGLKLDFRSPKVSFVEASSFGNISNARNTGLNHVCPLSNFIGFCDDDDLWLNNKVILQLAALDLNKWDACLTAAQLIDEKGRDSVRPSKPYLGECSPLKFIYSFGFRRKKYFPFPSLLCAAEPIKILRFDERLKEREDLRFLEDIYNLNLKIGQLAQPLIRISSNPMRSIERVSLRSDLDWMLSLWKTSKVASVSFLLFVSLRNQLFKTFNCLTSQFKN
jgi:glycosyltransferase involved in cell wall biosynthesis